MRDRGVPEMSVPRVRLASTQGLSITVAATSPISTGTCAVLSSPIVNTLCCHPAAAKVVQLIRLEGALHPAGDDRKAAGPVHGKEAEGPVEVHADIGDVVLQLR